MKKIIIAGFGQPVINLYNSFKNNFEIIGIIVDYHRRKKHPEFYEFLELENVELFTFEDVNIYKPDLVIVINYNKIIDNSTINIPFLLNIHMGLLPMYRGNSANSWAILNGDREVGYTLHEVDDILDGGQIYYKFKYKIEKNETYFHAKAAINKDLKNNLSNVIERVLDKTLKGKTQSGKKFIYAAKLIPEDGILNSWNYKTEEIISKNIIFSRPLGTGLKVKLKEGQIVEISKLSKVENYKKSKGILGVVVMKTVKGSIWVKTKDTAISIDELIIDNKRVKPVEIFKIGDRL